MTAADGHLPDLFDLLAGTAPAMRSTGNPSPVAPSSAGPSDGAVPSRSIVAARLALALNGGRLVPAYELTDAQGRTYRVPALTDAALEVLGG